VLALIGLWAVIYMVGLSQPALLDDADTVHAEAAREMLQRHDWVTMYTTASATWKKLRCRIGAWRPATASLALAIGARVCP